MASIIWSWLEKALVPCIIKGFWELADVLRLPPVLANDVFMPYSEKRGPPVMLIELIASSGRK